MEETRAARAHMLQRKQRLEQLVTKRKSNISYLKKFHEGDHYWMNVISMSKQELLDFVDKKVPDQRTVGYFYLGISLSKLFDEFNGGDTPSNPENVAKLIRGITQLIEEFEFYFSSSAMQSVKYAFARNAACMHPNLSPNSFQGDAPSAVGTTNLNDPDNIAKPNVYKYQSDVVYEFLLTPHIPFADSMDYLEVLTSLCVILLKVYNAFRDPICYKLVMFCPTVHP